MAQIFSSSIQAAEINGIQTIDSVETILDETAANKLILIGDNVRNIRLPHTKFMNDTLIRFNILNYTNVEDSRLVTFLPHWGETIDNDVTATMSLVLRETGAALVSDLSDNSWWIIEGKFEQLGGDFSSSSDNMTTSSSSDSSSTVGDKTSSSSTFQSFTSSSLSSLSSSSSSLASFTSSSTSSDNSSSSTFVSFSSTSVSSSSTEIQSTSSSSLEFSSFSNSSSSTSSSSSTEASLTSSSTTSQSSC